VPRTHQFLVTLTVHTNTINPAMTPTTPSATSMTNRPAVVVIQRDGQHESAERLSRYRFEAPHEGDFGGRAALTKHRYTESDDFKPQKARYWPLSS
jgi:hypothetical protein